MLRTLLPIILFLFCIATCYGASKGSVTLTEKRLGNNFCPVNDSVTTCTVRRTSTVDFDATFELLGSSINRCRLSYKFTGEEEVIRWLCRSNKNLYVDENECDNINIPTDQKLHLHVDNIIVPNSLSSAKVFQVNLKDIKYVGESGVDPNPIFCGNLVARMYG